MGRSSKGRGNGEGPGSRRRLAAAEKQSQALMLRKAGATYEQIGHELGLSVAGAYKAFQAGLQRTIQEPADEYRKVEFERLSAMLKSIWPRVLQGELHAIDRAIKIEERLAKLLGLDAAIKHDVNARMSYEQFIAGTFKPEDRIQPRKPDTESPADGGDA